MVARIRLHQDFKILNSHVQLIVYDRVTIRLYERVGEGALRPWKQLWSCRGGQLI